MIWTFPRKSASHPATKHSDRSLVSPCFAHAPQSARVAEHRGPPRVTIRLHDHGTARTAARGIVLDLARRPALDLPEDDRRREQDSRSPTPGASR